MSNTYRAMRGDGTLGGAPGRIVGAFTLAGGSAPTDIRGNITAVRRLVTTGGTIFFRVTLSVNSQLPAPQQCQATALPSAEAQHLLCNVREDLTADPADVKKAYEIDVTVYNPPTALTVDTAGIQVRLGMDAAV